MSYFRNCSLYEDINKPLTPEEMFSFGSLILYVKKYGDENVYIKKLVLKFITWLIELSNNNSCLRNEINKIDTNDKFILQGVYLISKCILFDKVNNVVYNFETSELYNIWELEEWITKVDEYIRLLS